MQNILTPQKKFNMSTLSLALSLFFIMNSIGSIPLFVAILGKFSPKKQRHIIFRELLIAFLILVLFAFFGERILSALGISQPVVGIGGGTVLFLISIAMIFPKKNDPLENKRNDPFVVPLAMPLIAGPGAITTVMIYADQIDNGFYMLAAILIAWIPSLLILLSASNLKNILGTKGLNALQRLGGMLICLMAVQMVATGIVQFVKKSFYIEHSKISEKTK
jgi:multiple antibiotic resistance protein